MISITTKALQTNLVSLADLKTAIAPGDSDDAFLAALIVRASSMFARKCNRKFAREVVTETFNGNGRTDILVSRFPLVNLGALTLNDATIATTNYKVLEVDAGIVFMETGWAKNVSVARVITVNQLDQPGDPDYSLAYTAGFLLPDDEIVSGVAITSGGDSTFTLAAGAWPLLVEGDKITFAAFDDADLNAEFTVLTRTGTVVTVSETVTGSEAGSAVTMTCQTLPEEIEQAVIELVNSWFVGRSRDASLKSEKIGDWAATYNTESGATLLMLMRSLTVTR